MWWILWITLVVIVAFILALVALFLYVTDNGSYWKKYGVDSPKTFELGTPLELLTFKIGAVEYDQRLYRRFAGQRYGGLMILRRPVLYLRDLELIKRVLVKDFDHFLDRRVMEFSGSDRIFGKMLTNKSGKEWKDLRSTMSPTFTTGRIKRMFEYFNSCGEKLGNYLKKAQEDGKSEVEFQDVFSRYALDVIASIVFGIQTDVFTNEDSQFSKMAKSAQRISIARIIKAILVLWAPRLAKVLALQIGDKDSTEFFSELIKQNIARRREGKEKRQDFLQMMLEAQEDQLKVDAKDLDSYEKDALLKDLPTPVKKDLAVIFDDETILAQTFLFFSAGFDTIESLLMFTAYELALNPDVQERLAEEIIPAMDEGEGKLSYEVTQGLQYLDMVISETLRHHPPAHATERTCMQDYQIPHSSLVIPKGTQVMVPIHSIQHDEEYYPNPDQFNPEHFSAENKAKRHPYAFLPFGQGPRNCIAMRFALTEAKAAIAHLVYNFTIEPCEKTDIPLILKRASIQKPANGMWLKFQARSSA